MQLPPEIIKLLPPQTIDLAPEDWLWVTYRPRVPLPRPEPKPFDQAEAKTRLREAAAKRADWSKANISPSLSREEAHFWFCAMTQGITLQAFDGQITLDEIRTKLMRYCGLIKPEIMLPLSNLLSVEEIIDLLWDEERIPLDPISHSWGEIYAQVYRSALFNTLFSGFQKYVLPYLTELELEKLRQSLHPHLNLDLWPNHPEGKMPFPFRWAAILGIHDIIDIGVKSWSDGSCDSYYWRYSDSTPYQVIFGLGSAELLEAEVRRLKLPLLESTHVRAWLAHTKHTALDVVRDGIRVASTKEDAEAMLKAFSLVHAPEAAPYMIDLMISSKAPQLARQWLDDHPEYSIAGAMALIAEDDALARSALALLTRLGQKGYTGLIQTYLEHFPAGTGQRVQAVFVQVEATSYPPFDDQTTPDWLRKSLPLSKKQPAKLPAWADPALLPPVIIGERCLNRDQVVVLLQSLKKCKLEQPLLPALVPLKTAADPTSLDAFAWRLFELWLHEGIGSADKWALNGVGLLGNAALALKLAQLVRVKVNLPEYKRIGLVESCLKAICTDTALLQFQSIAQKTKFKGLQAQGRLAMEAIARERGLSREQLEDRLVPDCGLDERGSRIFDFGPRQFCFAWGPNLKPLVRDAQGRVSPDLPKPGVKDDPVLANQAVTEWKTFKKELKQTFSLQTNRLEEAMINGRRWTVEDFATVLVGHPVLLNLAQRLLWAGFDATNNLVTTFRVTEDRTYADIEDEVTILDRVEQVGVIHPFYLSATVKSAWGEIFSDYELIPPFPQLGRETYRLEPVEMEATDLTRFAHLKVPAISMVSFLEQVGWDRGPNNGGFFDEHTRSFPAAKLKAVVRYDGIHAGDVVGADDQTIQGCFFIQDNLSSRRSWRKDEAKLLLKDIDPVIISEVLRDLTMIASKAK